MSVRVKQWEAVFGLVLILTSAFAQAQGPSKLDQLQLPLFVVQGERLILEVPGIDAVQLKRNGIATDLTRSDTNESHWSIPDSLKPGRYQLDSEDPDGSVIAKRPLYLLASEPTSIRIHFLTDEASIEPADPDQLNIVVQMGESKTIDEIYPHPVIPIETSSRTHLDLPQSIRIGKYGILIFNASDTDSRTAGRLHLLRRSLKSTRSTIGVSTTPMVQASFRTRLILMRDDPIQVLITPDIPKESQDVDNNSIPTYSWNESPLVIEMAPTGVKRIDTE